jgi:hypothetical protein
MPSDLHAAAPDDGLIDKALHHDLLKPKAVGTE